MVSFRRTELFRNFSKMSRSNHMNVKYIKRLFGVITCAIIVGFPVSWIVSDLMTAPNTIANFFAILILILYLLTLAMLLLQYALPASLDEPNDDVKES